MRRILIALALLLMATSLHAATTYYSDPVAWQEATAPGVTRTDTFNPTLYCGEGDTFCILSDADASVVSVQITGAMMSSTAFEDVNIFNDGDLCWGCNGSGVFLLPDEIRGFAVVVNQAQDGPEDDGGWTATVSYSDGSWDNAAIPTTVFDEVFLGVVSDKEIASVHLGGPDAAEWSSGGFKMTEMRVVEFPIFADGFESGDTSVWSTTTP